MKRYSVFGMGLAEDPAGNWVKFAEVEQQLAEVEARRQRLEALLWKFSDTEIDCQRIERLQ